MKKWFAIIIVMILCLGCVQAVYANATPMMTKQSKKTIMISIYDNIKQNHVVENTKISLDNETSILSTMQQLKDKNLIKDYAMKNGKISEVRLLDDTVCKIQTEPYPTEFTVKQNGIYVLQNLDTTMVKDGDIIEWIYSKQTTQVESANPNTTSSYQIKDTGRYWNDKTNESLNQSTNWLHLNNKSNSSSYLISMGVAGRTADIKAVNDFVDSVKIKHDYETPMAIAKNIMALTFCGYDASLNEYGSLVKLLSNYPNIMNAGILGAVDTLIALDSNHYTLPKDAINTRDKLISNILEFQQQDGGFSIMKSSASDIDTTAITLTALANYKEQILVQSAIDKGLIYLSKSQTGKGGFEFSGQENSESLSAVIIMLNTLDISLDDIRFRKNSQSLVDQLLSYQNSDGGFAHIKGEKSLNNATEQAIVALTSIKKSSNPYSLSLPIKSSKLTPTPQAAVSKDNAFLFLLLGIVLIIISVSAIVIAKSRLIKGNK
ncbi:terpene cyclase/mutase family protein [Paludicola sp. MB14-C6]|uniref:prenyltransferase/squalene oxidase repeat-containing protein n=1 Tax=Paludihabitans sp. MB14-C6 TaxID=3070656 RepID=UPI0027DBF881|nr:prenyltransferase/squalene oxidase repeat-containing protein [Paludicola sp. MB14-C6]WMJ23972.1 terpene cyclase/mutase family protein [Paludicola sp. MB14-C6]